MSDNLAAVRESMIGYLNALRRVHELECDGAMCVVTKYEAAITSAEADRLQALVAFGLVGCAMARAFQRPAPRQAAA